MKRLLFFTVTLLLMARGASFAQQTLDRQPSLAEVARAEEERRKTAKKAKLVITNANLSAADLAPISTMGSTPSTPAGTSPSGPVSAAEERDPEIRKPAAEDAGAKDQKYWSSRMANAKSDLSRTQMFYESMQNRINSLKNDVFNLDYPARGVAEKQLNAALAESEKLKKEIEAKTKGITAIEEEARRAGVPPGWLR